MIDNDSHKRRCFRCGGQKYMFTVGAGYSRVETGGTKVTCPLCDGEGVIEVNIDALKERVARLEDSNNDKQSTNKSKATRAKKARKTK